jgi:hypothetical protein
MMTMLITFFSMNGIVHYEFIPQSQTVNQAFYVEILKWLCEAVYKLCIEKRFEFWPNHNNAPADKLLYLKQFLAQNPLLKWNTHPINLICLQTTSGCFKKESALKGQRFQDTEDKKNSESI